MIIKFNNSDVEYDVDLSFGETINGGERVEIIGGNCPHSTAGFKVYDNNGNVKVDYSAYTTVYCTDYSGSGRFMLSNDGSVWHLPYPKVTFIAGNGGQLSGVASFETTDWAAVSAPTVVAEDGFEFQGWSMEVPASGAIDGNTTIVAIFNDVRQEEVDVKANKLAELQMANASAIERGVDVTLSDGSVEHFSLSTSDQMDITNAVIAVSTGAEEFPWHSDGNKCKFYSAADIMLIGNAAKKHVTYSVTLYKDTVDWVNSLTDKEEIEAIEYGMVPPVEHQSEVLKRLIEEEKAASRKK